MTVFLLVIESVRRVEMPKSPIFTTPEEDMSRFPALISLCMAFCSCMYRRPKMLQEENGLGMQGVDMAS